jgi:heat-inducible transcriptional repressor
MLTERRSRILRLIVEEYVESAAPVGSETMVRKYRLPVSPATIRNEMAKLEEEGYITHPYTSAGRLPSDQGYRYYIESLMDEQDLTLEEKETIRHQFHQAGRELEQWVRLSAAVLAQVARNMAVVTSPRSPECRLKHLEVVLLHDVVVLLVVVLQDGRLAQQVLSLPEALSREEITTLAHRLTDLYHGLTASRIQGRAVELTLLESQIIEEVQALMAAEDEGRYDEVCLEGVRLVLGQPEFSRGEKMLGLLAVLDQYSLSRVLPLRRLAGEGVTVVIGRENQEDALHDCSLLVTRYGVPGALSGALAVVGPTRMRYSRTISTVRYLGSLMSELVGQYV